MRYSYFPGCSLEATARSYAVSTEAVCKALGIELEELEDWNCCGATAFYSIDELLALSLAGRNLALAEKKGRDLVVSCSGCYITLEKANATLRDYPALKAQVDEVLAEADLEYHGGVKVRHFLEVFINDIGLEAIKDNLKKELKGLKVAPYYGCQIVRPQLGFDDTEFPESMDNLMAALGADIVPFPLKSRCCGGPLIVPQEKLALDLIHRLFRVADANGAQCLVTVCPLCQMNLDLYQSKVNSKYKTNYELPVLFFTQLVGVACGLDPKGLGLEMNIVSPRKVLAQYL
ncbi:MAG: CoB--CoM heterodisulfide reductase iron-sulfur subunit B family protein [Anaerolineae bacterium]